MGTMSQSPFSREIRLGGIVLTSLSTARCSHRTLSLREEPRCQIVTPGRRDGLVDTADHGMYSGPARFAEAAARSETGRSHHGETECVRDTGSRGRFRR